MRIDNDAIACRQGSFLSNTSRLSEHCLAIIDLRVCLPLHVYTNSGLSMYLPTKSTGQPWRLIHKKMNTVVTALLAGTIDIDIAACEDKPFGGRKGS